MSDVHSNIDAFNAVLNFLDAKEIDHIYIAGDLVGYYYYSADVIRVCMGNEKITCIRGNHDRDFIAALRDENLMVKLSSKYGSSHKRAQRELSENQVTWLGSLPSKLQFNLDGISLTIAHGSVDEEDLYIYPDAPISILAKQTLESDITVLGHTHYPFIWSKDNKYLLNPGSVGQPRDQGSHASVFVLDTSNRAVVPYKVKFSFERLKKDILRFDPDNKYLLQVLQRT